MNDQDQLQINTKIGIHPIVILTISDYFTRMNVTSNGKINKVFGGLLGQNNVDKSEIYSAFEFYNQSQDDSEINLDLNYIDERRKLTEQLYPNYQIIGFFMTNSTMNPNVISVNEVLKAMDFFGVVAPLCLILSTDLSNAEDLPVSIYQIEKNPQKFIKLDHIIEGCESERIVLDTVTKSTDFQNNESAMIQNMLTMKNALDVLKTNLRNIRKSLDNDKFKNDYHFISLIDDLAKNYPNVSNSDLISLLENKQEELLILNNICADSVGVSLQGRVDSFPVNYKSNKDIKMWSVQDEINN